MFVKFLIFACIIGTAGPGHNEGGFEAIKDKGPKDAIVQAWDERKPYHSGSLELSSTGNFGNE